ncbi:MAG: SPASM domain-containing protein [Spirochaetaceae bacterium]|jgi:MoaA/NifB/PqqE/SkfB family radical SAM enzyme|nr:SPASM domain-containing protein [Spirochaetaceae bacterium]
MIISHNLYVKIKKILKPFRNYIFKPPHTNQAYDKTIDPNPPPPPAFAEESLERHISRISIELSNLCNYAHRHKKCPVSWYTEKKILSSEIFFKVVNELAGYGFCGELAFHRYNEPMLDKRLYDFIGYVNKKLPRAKIFILTNGSFLNQETLQKLEQHKIWLITVSSYDFKEHERLSKLQTAIPYRVYFSHLDDREDIYSRRPINSGDPCYATLRDITVNCCGDLSICCLDWRNDYTFGSLKDHSLKELLNSPAFLAVHRDLFQGRRNLEICRRCDWQR